MRIALAVVVGYLSMLDDGTFGQVTPDWSRVVQILIQKGGELNGIVDGLLTAARIEAGHAGNLETSKWCAVFPLFAELTTSPPEAPRLGRLHFVGSPQPAGERPQVPHPRPPLPPLRRAARPRLRADRPRRAGEAAEGLSAPVNVAL